MHLRIEAGEDEWEYQIDNDSRQPVLEEIVTDLWRVLSNAQSNFSKFEIKECEDRYYLLARVKEPENTTRRRENS